MENNFNQTGRRDFLKKCSGVIGLSISLPLIGNLMISCEHDPPSAPILTLGNLTLNIADYPTLQNVGGWLMPTYPDKNGGLPIIIIRETSDTFLVLTSKCQHQGCVVGSPNDSKEIICPCHGSTYSTIDGSVIHGPTTRALPKFKNSYDSQTKILIIF